MILKIRAANAGTDDSWRFFDGVRGLHYSIYDAGVFSQTPESPQCDDVQYVRFWYEDVPFKVVVLVFDSETTGPIEITCNTCVYLMNDQGRTVEKLI